MINLERIKGMSAEELAVFLNKIDCIEHQPWRKWSDEKFCKKCKPVKVHHIGGTREFEVMPCEIGDCPFGMGTDANWCLMWLNSEGE